MSARATEGVAVDKETLLKQASEATLGGVNSSLRNVRPPLVIVHTEGAYICDPDGKQYLDYQAAFGPPILGHSHPHVCERIRETLARLDLPGIGTALLEIELAR
jgi:glutamate-1-semialdehyde 2,1-aminomutase